MKKPVATKIKKGSAKKSPFVLGKTGAVKPKVMTLPKGGGKYGKHCMEC